MELQNTLRDLFAGRRQPNVRLGAIENIIQNEPQEVVEIIDPAILPPVPVEVEVAVEEDKEPEDTCTVCLEELTAENTHELKCGHKAVCKDCHPTMMTMNIGNGCVGEDPETCVKVIKCPICRQEDTPTREQLIAEIVRMRRGGYIRPLPRVPVPLPVHAPVPQHQPINHNLPAVIPVLQPVIQHNQPVPAHRVGGLQNGNWLRGQHFRPNRGEDLHRNHLPGNVFNMPNDVARWNILRGHAPEDAIRVGEFLTGGQWVANGFICGVAGTRRFYHHQFFIPEETEGNVPSRRNCNNAPCLGNHRSRTARRCPRGCGQFICQACNGCNTPACQPIN